MGFSIAQEPSDFIKLVVRVWIWVMLLSSIFGEYFYKLFFPIELSITIVIAVWIHQLFNRTARVRINAYFLFCLLIIVYFLASWIDLSRQPYWICRQSTLFVMATYGYVFFTESVRCGPDRLIHWISNYILRFYRLSIAAVIINTIISLVAEHSFGDEAFINIGISRFLPAEAFRGQAITAGFALFLVMTWACLSRYGIKSVITRTALFFLLVSGIGTTHLAWSALPFVILAIASGAGNRLVAFVCLSICILFIFYSVFISSELSDANAIWRYMYWHDVVVSSWTNFKFILGRGFGISYMPEDGENYSKILWQVSSDENAAEQPMAVPPHNGLLSLLIFGGGPLVFLFVSPVIVFIKTSFLQKTQQNIALLAIIIAQFILILSHPWMDLNYCSIAFWPLYGLMVSKSTPQAVLPS